MAPCVAFLRGINVGGHKPVRMDGVRRAFQALGFRNVKTLLASGNVLFESRASNRTALVAKIEQKLAAACGHEISVILHSIEELERLAATQPFRAIRVTPRTRLFVTFLSAPPRSKLKIPYLSPDRSYRILTVRDRAVCSVLTVGPQWSKNLRQMNILEKEFGKKITTRSWSTVLRIVKAAAPTR